MVENITNWFLSQGTSEPTSEVLTWVTLALAVGLAAFVSNLIAKRVLLGALSIVVKKSRTTWDDALEKRHVFARLSHLAPALVVHSSAPLFAEWADSIQRISVVYMILAGLLVINAFLNSVNDIYSSFDISRNKPIKGYLQVLKIILAILVAVLAIAVLMGQSLLVLFSGIGAMTAVLMLIFKDSILGLVAGIQLSMNDMVRIGDWIEMPQFEADGDVIDITLHSVLVQNWDKTITSIPAYSMISGSFKNWRGMSDSGGRRIKRSILIDIESIKFCDEKMLHRYRNFELVRKYVEARQKEIALHNEKLAVDQSELLNGRRMTNIGVFRTYIKEYLRQNPRIHDGMTFLVRQLPPGEHGLPIEIYVFSNDQDWIRYEEIQADIFDHLLAVLPLFELRTFQHPSNAALEQVVRTISR